MNTLKKYISVIAISTAGFAVDVLKKHDGHPCGRIFAQGMEALLSAF